MNSLLLISIFGLFHPQEVLVRPASGQALAVESAGRKVSARETLRFRLSENPEPTRIESPHGSLIVSIPGKIEREFSGSLEISAAGGELHVLVRMTMERSVAAVIAAEGQGSPESMKAQAVASRSWYAASRGRHGAYDFCDTTHCQYLAAPSAASADATRATQGLVVRWQNQTVPVLYSASCGGRTYAAVEVGLPADGYPFFHAECEPCTRSAPRWERTLEGEDASAILARPHAETVRLQIVRRLGWDALPSNHYEIERAGGTIVLRGAGRGHGVGLCQLGAARMAAAGKRFDEILRHYLPNTSIASDPRLRPIPLPAGAANW